MAKKDYSNLFYKIGTEKIYLPFTILEHWHFIQIAQNSHFLRLLNIKMMKMAKRDPRRTLMLLKLCGNAFSAQKTYMGSILDRKTSKFGLKCPKMAFLAILDKKKFLSSKLMLYHMGGPTDLTCKYI